jgi:BirA family biotin operon repressor/biotin-[acetyl-CoA-carboxylase] ligase
VSQPAPEWAFVTAECQTAGRGRRGRSWLSTGGENLLMSVVLRPPYPIDQGWRLGFVAAVAVAEALDQFGVITALKWPNDVLIAGRKASGILVETLVESGRGWIAVVGIGVNVNQRDFGTESGAPSGDGVGRGHHFEWEPTSLALARRMDVSVSEVRDAVHSCLQATELLNRTAGFSGVAAAWRARMAAGLQIRRGDERGIQSALVDDGSVRVLLPDGTFALWRTVDREEPCNGV